MTRVFTRSRLGGPGGSSVVKATGPSLIGISPSFGDEAGGDAVTITGRNLGAVTAVTIGGSSATSVVQVSDRVITCVTPAGSGTGNVVVTAGGKTLTLSGAFAYGGSLTVLKQIDWTTATGTTSNAVTDGDKLNVTNGIPTANHEVVAVASADGTWPAGITNVLQLSLRGSPSSLVGYDDLDEMTEGETRACRWYQVESHVYDGAADNNFHQQGLKSTSGGTAGEFNHILASNGTEYEAGMKTGAELGGASEHRWGITDLLIGRCYRVEFKYTRLADSGGVAYFTEEMRIYDVAVSDSTPAYTSSDITCNRSGHASPGHTLADAVHDGEVSGANVKIDDGLAALTGHFKFACPGGSEDLTGNTWYGGFVCADDWPGAYGDVAGES